MPLLVLCIISQSSVNSNLIYSPESLKLGQHWRFLASRDLEISHMTFKNNKASLLCLCKHCASFRSHQWIYIWVTVRKHSNPVEFDDYCGKVVLPYLNTPILKAWGAHRPLTTGIVRRLCEQYVKSLGLTPSGFDFLFRTRPRALRQQTPPEPVLISCLVLSCHIFCKLPDEISRKRGCAA